MQSCYKRSFNEGNNRTTNKYKKNYIKKRTSEKLEKDKVELPTNLPQKAKMVFEKNTKEKTNNLFIF
ncbi:hypothetical protein BD847_3029 [Flavobacterium cutihirudinis]|uniref:Uncharacterized protein n=1 Tax=Flavobacterium cutihirudinis TaxID=1265740 RepID=A0A3D9FPT5_9FLAO|nr:hypothetical protein BD847_3029 [Flavobacterium cutihirudinis]